MSDENTTEQAEPAVASAPEETTGSAAAAPEAEAATETSAPAPTAASAPSHAPYEGQQQQRRGPGGGKRFPRRKVCAFCVDKIDYIDYKDTKRARKFMTERGKILPRRITGNCAAHQRMLTAAIKRARVVALVPYKTD
jgi:small subunit ribosomal protein S18